MKLDASNNPAIRDFENYVKDELYGSKPSSHEQPASAAGSERRLSTRCDNAQHERCLYAGECECECHNQPAPTAPETGEEWRIDEAGPRKGRVVIRDEKDRLSVYVLYGAFDQCEPVSIAGAVERAEQIVKEHNSHQLLIDSLKQIHAALPDGIRLTPTETKIATIVADTLRDIKEETK